MGLIVGHSLLYEKMNDIKLSLKFKFWIKPVHENNLQLISVLARKFGLNCKDLISVPGEIVNKQEMMDLTKQIQNQEDAVIELLHTRVNANPNEFPF